MCQEFIETKEENIDEDFPGFHFKNIQTIFDVLPESTLDVAVDGG
jgi:hypothetical protein